MSKRPRGVPDPDGLHGVSQDQRLDLKHVCTKRGLAARGRFWRCRSGPFRTSRGTHGRRRHGAVRSVKREHNRSSARAILRHHVHARRSEGSKQLEVEQPVRKSGGFMPNTRPGGEFAFQRQLKSERDLDDDSYGFAIEQQHHPVSAELQRQLLLRPDHRC